MNILNFIINFFELVIDIILSFGPLALVIFVPILTMILFIGSLIITIVKRKNKTVFTIFLLLSIVFGTITIVTAACILTIISFFIIVIMGM